MQTDLTMERLSELRGTDVLSSDSEKIGRSKRSSSTSRRSGPSGVPVQGANRVTREPID
jgi:hypothetical protein